MRSTVLLCIDGSELSLAAAAAGRALLAPDTAVAIVTVSDAPDVAETVGSGHAGPAISPEEFDRKTKAADAAARSNLAAAAEALDLPDAATHVLGGHPGQAICRLAAELSAAALVIGSRGHGGLKRVVLGSVSDYVVRNAPCTVVVTAPQGVADDRR